MVGNGWQLEREFPGFLGELLPCLRPARFKAGDPIYTPHLSAR